MKNGFNGFFMVLVSVTMYYGNPANNHLFIEMVRRRTSHRGVYLSISHLCQVFLSLYAQIQANLRDPPHLGIQRIVSSGWLRIELLVSAQNPNSQHHTDSWKRFVLPQTTRRELTLMTKTDTAGIVRHSPNMSPAIANLVRKAAMVVKITDCHPRSRLRAARAEL